MKGGIVPHVYGSPEAILVPCLLLPDSVSARVSYASGRRLDRTEMLGGDTIYRR
jgi:hypothetical protein